MQSNQTENGIHTNAIISDIFKLPLCVMDKYPCSANDVIYSGNERCRSPHKASADCGNRAVLEYISLLAPTTLSTCASNASAIATIQEFFYMLGTVAPRWGLTTSLVSGWGHNGPVLATKASGFGNNGWWQWVGRISSINDQYCHRIPPNADTPN